MGTRHNIRVKLDGKLMVRQYGQWDGYPTGQGSDIASFLHEEMDREKFRTALRECRFMTQTEIDDFNAENRDKNWQRTHPWLSRDAGAKVLAMIQKGDARALVESKDDEDKETWCEFFYLIDMDEETVSMRSRHDSYPEITLPFAEWTAERMEQLETDPDDAEAA